MNVHRAALLLSAGLSAVSLAHAAGQVLLNSRLAITFDDTSVFSFSDADRVDHIAWIDSSGVTRNNYTAAGGPSHCGDPQEFFGQSYGEPEGTCPLMVFGGVHDTWAGTTGLKGSATPPVAGERLPAQPVGPPPLREPVRRPSPKGRSPLGGPSAGPARRATPGDPQSRVVSSPSPRYRWMHGCGWRSRRPGRLHAAVGRGAG